MPLPPILPEATESILEELRLVDWPITGNYLTSSDVAKACLGTSKHGLQHRITRSQPRPIFCPLAAHPLMPGLPLPVLSLLCCLTRPLPPPMFSLLCCWTCRCAETRTAALKELLHQSDTCSLGELPLRGLRRPAAPTAAVSRRERHHSSQWQAQWPDCQQERRRVNKGSSLLCQSIKLLDAQ